jgi:hypothetical protein
MEQCEHPREALEFVERDQMETEGQVYCSWFRCQKCNTYISVIEGDNYAKFENPS